MEHIKSQLKKSLLGKYLKCKCGGQAYISLEDFRYFTNCLNCGEHKLLKLLKK